MPTKRAAFIDWDLAGPGRRIQDVAHVCWTWLDLGPGVRDRDIPKTARPVQLILTAYGAAFDVGEVLGAVTWWQHRCWQQMEQQAADGDLAMQALVADGTAASIREAAEWTESHASDLRQAV